ncbi:copper amine oxidase N-terminal domain-containing protein [Paenibacillus sp. 1P07SE]|uniref:copper amine oxidase N-terminal domain-containing protein n=1 Tax=Paenibacillus sp. 1P07SE TaxID=3132209 RepID=UPI0039A415AA
MNLHGWETARMRWLRRGLIALLTATLVLAAFGLQSTRAAESAITVKINDEAIVLDTAPYLHNGTTLVPMRPLFEALGIKLDWVPATKTVRGTGEGLELSLTVGSKQARINGSAVTLNEAAVIRGGSTLVPLRFVSEASDALVLWDPYTRQVLVYEESFLQSNNSTKEAVSQGFQHYLEEKRKEIEASNSGGGNGGNANDRMCSVWRYHPIYGGSLEWVPC